MALILLSSLSSQGGPDGLAGWSEGAVGSDIQYENHFIITDSEEDTYCVETSVFLHHIKLAVCFTSFPLFCHFILSGFTCWIVDNLFLSAISFLAEEKS